MSATVVGEHRTHAHSNLYAHADLKAKLNMDSSWLQQHSPSFSAGIYCTFSTPTAQTYSSDSAAISKTS